MNIYFTTKNTTYTVTSAGLDTCFLNGGQFHDLLIRKPNQMIGEGQPFVAYLANDPSKYVKTSPIQSIHALPSQNYSYEMEEDYELG